MCVEQFPELDLLPEFFEEHVVVASTELSISPERSNKVDGDNTLFQPDLCVRPSCTQKGELGLIDGESVNTYHQAVFNLPREE